MSIFGCNDSVAANLSVLVIKRTKMTSWVPDFWINKVRSNALTPPCPNPYVHPAHSCATPWTRNFYFCNSPFWFSMVLAYSAKANSRKVLLHKHHSSKKQSVGPIFVTGDELPSGGSDRDHPQGQSWFWNHCCKSSHLILSSPEVEIFMALLTLLIRSVQIYSHTCVV